MKKQQQSTELFILGMPVRLVFAAEQNCEAAAAVQAILKRAYLQRKVKA